MKHIVALTVAILSLSPLVAQGATSPQGPMFHLTRTVPLGTPDRWDYLQYDLPSHTLYASHGSEVTVVDGHTGKITGRVSGIEGGTHGVVLLNSLGKGYTDDGDKALAIVFDLKTKKILKSIPAQDDADGIVYDPHSKHLFVIGSDSGKITVIDPVTDKVITTIDAGGKLEFGVTGGNGKAYFNGAGNNDIVRVDTDKNVVDAHWPLAGCESPHGLDLDKKNSRLFSSCKNSRLNIVDSKDGKQIAAFDIGKGSDAVVYDVKRHLIFSSNAEGTLSIISQKNADTYQELPPLKTALGARNMALDPESGRIFLVTGDYSINKDAPPADFRKRYTVKPGTAKLLFLDPVAAK